MAASTMTTNCPSSESHATSRLPPPRIEISQPTPPPQAAPHPISPPTSAGTSKPASSNCPTHLLKTLKRDGYVHIPSLLDASQLSALRSAAQHITSLARAGQWPHIRTVQRHSPPWPSTPPLPSEGGIWGVQHLLHPDMPSRKEFAKVYFGNRVIAVVKELLGLNLYDPRSEDQIVMELFNLLVSPSGDEDFELRWHRDGIPWDVNGDEERRQLERKSPGGRQAHTQYNIALGDNDESLIVIPASHRRVRTEDEQAAGRYEPHLPGQVVVKMNAGDAVFYDNNILHRVVYRSIDPDNNKNKDDADLGRMTLHGSVGLYGRSDARARSVLQHGVGDWVDRDDAAFTDLQQGRFRDRAEGMRLRLVEMGGTNEGRYVMDG